MTKDKDKEETETKAEDYAKTISDLMFSGHFSTLLSLSKDKDELVYGWLDLDRDFTGWTHPQNNSAFRSLCSTLWEYWVPAFFEKSELKKRIAAKTLSVDDAVDGLNKSMLEDILKALHQLGETLGGDEGERVKKVGSELKTQFDNICTTVADKVKESHDTIKVAVGGGESDGASKKKAATGDAADADPEWQPPNGKGYFKFEHTHTPTDGVAAKWTFGLRCVDLSGSGPEDREYVLPEGAGDGALQVEEYQWQLVKGEPIIVEIDTNPADRQQKYTNAPDHLEIDTKVKENFKEGDAWVKKILEVWQDEKWYPTPGPSTDEDLEDKYKVPVDEFVDEGYKWKFTLAWVDKDEKFYVPPDADKKARDHLVAPSGQKVVVSLVEDETITREVKVDTWVPNVGKELDNAAKKAAVDGFYADGGASKWNPTEPSTDDPAPDTHKVAVPGRVSEGYKWTFAMAYANEDSTVFLKRESKRKKHLVIPKGEKIVVGRDDGKGDPKETITDELYDLADGADENGAAAIARLLEVDEEKWFPADLEVQEKAKADTKKLEDVKAKLTAVQTDFGKQKAFGVAWLKAGVKKRSCTPEELQHITEEWESFVTLHGGVEASPDTVDEMRGVVTDGQKLVDTVVEKGGGGHSNLTKLKQLCDQLDVALTKAFPPAA